MLQSMEYEVNKPHALVFGHDESSCFSVSLKDIEKGLKWHFLHVATSLEMDLIEAAIRWANENPSTVQMEESLCALVEEVEKERSMGDENRKDRSL
jgi:hypothetical protein